MNKYIVALILSILGASLLPPVVSADKGIITGYSWESSSPQWGRVARYTGEVPIVGLHAACPPEWKFYTIHVEGLGQRICVDTGAYDYLQGKVHIDVYMIHAEALRFGLQEREVNIVYPTEEEKINIQRGITPKFKEKKQ